MAEIQSAQQHHLQLDGGGVQHHHTLIARVIPRCSRRVWAMAEVWWVQEVLQVEVQWGVMDEVVVR